MLEDEREPLNEQTTLKNAVVAQPEQVESAWPPPPRPRPSQGPSKAVRVLTILLAALLVVGGLGALIYATTSQYGLAVGAQQRLSTNATVRSQVASQATQVSSLRATAQPLATTQAAIYATATAQDQSTTTSQPGQDQATATATTMQALLTQDTSGTPTLNDPLSDNSMGNGWDEVSSNNQGTSCGFPTGSYEVQEGLQGFLKPCFATNSNFTNFVYQMSLTIITGSEGGIVFCANASKDQYYLFRIDINGNYALELYNGTQYALLAQGKNSAISTGVGSSNTLTVIVNKGTLALFVNSMYVDGANNTTLSKGEIGVVALDRNLPTTVDFSNAQVWSVS